MMSVRNASTARRRSRPRACTSGLVSCARGTACSSPAEHRLDLRAHLVDARAQLLLLLAQLGLEAVALRAQLVAEVVGRTAPGEDQGEEEDDAERAATLRRYLGGPGVTRPLSPVTRRAGRLDRRSPRRSRLAVLRCGDADVAAEPVEYCVVGLRHHAEARRCGSTRIARVVRRPRLGANCGRGSWRSSSRRRPCSCLDRHARAGQAGRDRAAEAHGALLRRYGLTFFVLRLDLQHGLDHDDRADDVGPLRHQRRGTAWSRGRRRRRTRTCLAASVTSGLPTVTNPANGHGLACSTTSRLALLGPSGAPGQLRAARRGRPGSASRRRSRCRAAGPWS